MPSRVIITARDRKRQSSLAKIYAGPQENQFLSFATLYTSEVKEEHDDCPECIAERAAALAARTASTSSSSSSSTPKRSSSILTTSSSYSADSDASSIATLPDTDRPTVRFFIEDDEESSELEPVILTAPTETESDYSLRRVANRAAAAAAASASKKAPAPSSGVKGLGQEERGFLASLRARGMEIAATA